MSVAVRGNATAEELAAVLAVISQRRQTPQADGYERWRAGRLAALRRCATIVR
jgi:hypothetical protein